MKQPTNKKRIKTTAIADAMLATVSENGVVSRKATSLHMGLSPAFFSQPWRRRNFDKAFQLAKLRNPLITKPKSWNTGTHFSSEMSVLVSLVLVDGPTTVAKIVKKTGFDKKLIQKGIHRLKQEGNILSCQTIYHGCVEYSLVEGGKFKHLAEAIRGWRETGSLRKHHGLTNRETERFSALKRVVAEYLKNSVSSKKGQIDENIHAKVICRVSRFGSVDAQKCCTALWSTLGDMGLSGERAIEFMEGQLSQYEELEPCPSPYTGFYRMRRAASPSPHFRAEVGGIIHN